MKSIITSTENHISLLTKPFLILFFMLGLWSCDHDTDPEDPNLIDRFGPFEVVQDFEASTEVVDFSASGTVVFTAEFNKNINWVITITGNTSGAIKRIEGFNRIINAQNATWDGRTSVLPFFKNEMCSVEITIPEEPDYMDSAEVEVIGTRTYDGNLITDWENGLNPGFELFVQSGADMRFDTVVSPLSAEGNAFYETSGLVDFSDDLGNIAMPKDAFTDEFILSPNSELVYFNVFARKGINSVGDIYVFQFMEDDDGNGSFNPNVDDLHEFVFQDLSEDWEQFSIQYANLTTPNNSGGGQKNPDRLIRVVMLPIGLGEPFECYLDFLIFTEGGPLQL